MSQNAKQLSLQIRRCATPSYFLLLGHCIVLRLKLPLVCALASCFMDTAKTRDFHLAIYGCNMWEMEHTEDLHMLWMHVDGSP